MKKIKIIDVSSLVPGPFASFLLEKHLDSEVIKFEDVNQPDPFIHMRPTKDGIGLGYVALNQNKKVIKVDFRKNGLDLIKKELADADIFIENFKPGRAYKLGIGYEDVVKIQPTIVYCSISGFSEKSVLGKKSAHDLNILALSGYLDQQYTLENISYLPPIVLADVMTAYHTAIVLLATMIQERRPHHVHVSMYEAFLESLTINTYPQIVLKQAFSAVDYVLSGKLPCYGVYETKDGKKIAVASLEKPLWIDFCSEIQREDLVEKQFDVPIVEEIAKEMKKYDRDYWLSDAFDFCVTPVLSVREAIAQHYV